MLKEIGLESYKCYKNKAEFDIKPLTILCGVNSSGKSSIIKSLLLLMQSYENGASSNEITFNGKFCNCGNFDDVVFNGEGETFDIVNKFAIVNSMDKNGNAYDHSDIVSYKELNKIYRQKDQMKIVKFDLTVKLTIAKFNSSSNIYVDGNRINKYEIEIVASREKHDSICSRLFLKRVGESSNRYDMMLENFPDLDGKPINNMSKNCICYFSGVRLNNLYKKNLEFQVGNALANILTVFRVIANQYNGMKFIAPLRESPKRYYISDRNVNDVGVTGEDTALLLAKDKKKSKKEIVQPPNQDETYKFECKKESFLNSIQKWLSYFDLGTVEITGQDIVRLNISGHNIVDVGFGVSQILPIITQGLNMQKEETFILEQPEIHLHPKMQMKMADFILSLALSEKNVIAETHSDHIINRLCRRIMENEELRNIVNIYFIDKDRDGNITYELVNVDKIDGITIENENFFYQFASETEKIVDVGYKNMLGSEK